MTITIEQSTFFGSPVWVVKHAGSFVGVYDDESSARADAARYLASIDAGERS